MENVFKNPPQIVREAKKADIKAHYVVQILIFIVVFLVSQTLSAIPVMVMMVAQLITGAQKGTVDLTDSENVTATLLESGTNVLPMLFVTGIATLLVIFYVKKIEKRSYYSMGFVKKAWAKDYLIGLGIGFAMFFTSIIIAYVTGSIEYNGFVLGNGLGMILVFFLAFMIQGMSEEVTMRGYFMMSLSTRAPLVVAVLTNAVFFGILHLLNTGVTFLSFINIVLFGVFASIYTLKKNSLWGICAIHSMWNFVQGNVFGIKVSGIDTKLSVLSFSPIDGKSLINGGIFGLEGGLAVTIVLLVGIGIIWTRKTTVTDELPETVDVIDEL